MELTFANIVGKTVIVCIVFLYNDKTLFSRIQFSGEILQASKREGIRVFSQNIKNVINLIPDFSSKGQDGIYILPPDLLSLHIAPIGEYKLKSTGEIIKNPDFLSTWTFIAPVPTANAGTT